MSADLISALNRAAVRPVEVLGVKLHVRGFTVPDRLAFADACRKAQEEPGALWTDAEIACRGICTAEGERVFAEPAALDSLDGEAVMQIARHVLLASGLGDKSGEEAEGN